jgi:hypothetical protein
MSAENKRPSVESLPAGANQFGAGINYERPAAPKHAAKTTVAFTEPRAVVEKYGANIKFKRPSLTTKI